MNQIKQQFAGYLVPAVFERFEWHRFIGQNTSSVTYIYLVTPPVHRLRGQSSVLYIGKTEKAINKRFEQQTKTKNTPRNSQATNIRLTAVMRTLREQGDKIDLYFTHSLTCHLSSRETEAFSSLLQVWNKNHFLKHFKPDASGGVEVSIETFLLVHYATAHLEVPPLNNSV